MNTLLYMTLEDAAAAIRSGHKRRPAIHTLLDGTVVSASAPIIEQPGDKHPDVEIVEKNVGSSAWKRVQGDGYYHYELLVARHGITPVVDANGDECGFRVNGTDRANA